MATGLIILFCGMVILAGTCAIADALNSEKPDVIRAKIKEVEDVINGVNVLLDKYNGMLEELEATERKLEQARRNFLDGGYVYSNKELASDYFSKCFYDLTYAITNTEIVIKSLEEKKAPSEKDLKDLQNHLNEVLQKEAEKKAKAAG